MLVLKFQKEHQQSEKTFRFTVTTFNKHLTNEEKLRRIEVLKFELPFAKNYVFEHTVFDSSIQTDINKQCGCRSDATKCGLHQGLYCLPLIKHF